MPYDMVREGTATPYALQFVCVIATKLSKGIVFSSLKK